MIYYCVTWYAFVCVCHPFSPISVSVDLVLSLQWLHNDHDSVSNHQPHDCLLNRLFGRRSKNTSKLRVTGLCVGNSPGTGEFPAQMASNAENVSIWWRHHGAGLFLHIEQIHYSDVIMGTMASQITMQPHDCWINRLRRRWSKKTSKLRVSGLCEENSPVTGEFPAQMASNAENVSIWWTHLMHVT